MADEYPFPIPWPESPFQLAERSFHHVTADYELIRFFSATIYVHEEDQARTEAIFNDLVGILISRAHEYGLRVYERPVWGPFDGSRFQTIFGSSKGHVLGGAFRERLQQLAEEVAEGFKHLSKHGHAIIIVGNLGIAMAGGADVAATRFDIPPEVTHSIVLASAAAGAAGGLRRLYKKETKTDPPS